MTIDWQSLAALAGLGTVWSGINLWAVKWLLSRLERSLENRLVDLDGKDARMESEMHRIDKELLKLRGSLPLEYVRREDDIRKEVVINAKLDALSLKIDQLRNP
jgi:hypothetical protein